MTIEMQLQTAQAELSKMQECIAEKDTAFDALSEKLKAMTELEAKASAELVESKAIAESQKVEIEKLQATIKTLEAEKQSVAAKAAQIASSVGVQPIPTQAASAESKPKTLTQQCAEKKGIKI